MLTLAMRGDQFNFLTAIMTAVLMVRIYPKIFVNFRVQIILHKELNKVAVKQSNLYIQRIKNKVEK